MSSTTSDQTPIPDPKLAHVNGIALTLEPDVALHRTIVRLADHPHKVGTVLNIDEGGWAPVLRLEAAFAELLGQQHHRNRIIEAGVHAWRVTTRRVLELTSPNAAPRSRARRVVK